MPPMAGPLVAALVFWQIGALRGPRRGQAAEQEICTLPTRDRCSRTSRGAEQFDGGTAQLGQAVRGPTIRGR